MLLRRVIIGFFVFLFLQIQFFASVIAADNCTNFYDAVVKKKQINFPYTKYNDLGIFFDYSWDQDKQERIIKRNKNKFPIIRASIFEEKLSPGTVVKTVDNKDLSTMSDEDIWALNKNYKSTEIQFFEENKISNIQVFSREYNALIFYFIYFSLNSINSIEAKEGYFSIDYTAVFEHERTDLKEEAKFLRHEYSKCPMNIKIEEKNIFSPNHTDLTLIHFEHDKDKAAAEDYFYYDDDVNSIFYETTFKGMAKIRAKFDFSKFPFDTQIIKIQFNTGDAYTIVDKDEIVEKNEPQLVSIAASDKVFLSLNDYMENNYLQEWRVVGTEVSNEMVLNKDFSTSQQKHYSDTITLALKVKRHFKYYIFKIIIPVFLILSVAWYVLWIPTKEIESRLTTSIVALLSLIAYNFVFQDDIPKLDILTSLDKFILLSYAFCAIPIFTTIRLSRAIEKSQKRASAMNRKIRLFGGAIYLFLTLTIFYPAL